MSKHGKKAQKISYPRPPHPHKVATMINTGQKAQKSAFQDHFINRKESCLVIAS